MNVTFLVGNGFDLNIGLKTSFKDFISYFCEKCDSNNMISKWIKDDFTNKGDFYTLDTWSDLEMQLGHRLIDVNDDLIEEFVRSKEELEILLIKYLEEQCENINYKKNEEINTKTLKQSIENLFTYCGESFETELLNVVSAHIKEKWNYRFITFNYTNTLDEIIDTYHRNESINLTHKNGAENIQDDINEVIHVHGTLDDGLVLGINDASQINNAKLVNKGAIIGAMVKETLNRYTAHDNVQKGKTLIENSDIICVFGMSYGETDRLWWLQVIYWLKTNGHARLVLFEYSKHYDKRIATSVQRIKRNAVYKLQKAAGISESEINSLRARIIIAVNTNLFKFDLLEGVGDEQ